MGRLSGLHLDGDSAATDLNAAADTGNYLKSSNQRAGGVNLVGVERVVGELAVDGRRSRFQNRSVRIGSCQTDCAPRLRLEERY